jgi:hypothetical protein
MNAMKHLFPFFLIFLSAGWLNAELVFESQQIELQAGLADEKAEAVFRFRNDGDTAITIKRVKSSCGCTVPELDKNEYAPGESGEIRALFTFGSRTGKQQKRITVETNEGSGKIHSLMFVTHIPQWGSIQPQLLRWTLDQELAPKEIRLQIELPDQVSVTGRTLEMEHFTIEETGSEPGLRVYSVTPKTTATRVTERFEVTLSAGEGDSGKTRQLVVYCLVR